MVHVLSDKMQEALNKQINAELYSSYLYLAMSAYFESTDMPGAANWMRCQAQEELLHAMKFFTFVNERDGRVLLSGVEGPQTEWASPLEVFQHVYQHEQHVTSLINGLATLAQQEGDHATSFFLQWFINEQVEEEASARAVLQQLKLVGDSGHGLFAIDRELATRVFVMPAPATEGGAGA